jgi:hypothetical protein
MARSELLSGDQQRNDDHLESAGSQGVFERRVSYGCSVCGLRPF